MIFSENEMAERDEGTAKEKNLQRLYKLTDWVLPVICSAMEDFS